MTFKNHGRQVRQNLKVTFGNWTVLDVHNNTTNFRGWNEFWCRMTAEERKWAETFERMEYQIERGYGVESRALASDLNPTITADAITRITDDVESKKRCNPAKMEADRRADIKRGHTKGIQKPRSTMYDTLDWDKTGGLIPSDDETQANGEPALEEKGITLNPEDALIQALDAARAHGVSLDEFVNNPKYHTAERKAGRPKKIKE